MSRLPTRIPFNLIGECAITLTCNLAKKGITNILPPRTGHHCTALLVVEPRLQDHHAAAPPYEPTLRIPANNARGYQALRLPGIINVAFPKSTNRRGRVQRHGSVSPTILCQSELVIVSLEPFIPRPMHSPAEQISPETLRDYFAPRIYLRKMTPGEALRLMDLTEPQIQAVLNSTRKVPLKNGTVKLVPMAKTNAFVLAGNSIVVAQLYHLLRVMFIPGQAENQRPPAPPANQRSLFPNL